MTTESIVIASHQLQILSVLKNTVVAVTGSGKTMFHFYNCSPNRPFYSK